MTQVFRRLLLRSWRPHGQLQVSNLTLMLAVPRSSPLNVSIIDQPEYRHHVLRLQLLPRRRRQRAPRPASLRPATATADLLRPAFTLRRAADGLWRSGSATAAVYRLPYWRTATSGNWVPASATAATSADWFPAAATAAAAVHGIPAVAAYGLPTTATHSVPATATTYRLSIAATASAPTAADRLPR